MIRNLLVVDDDPIFQFGMELLVKEIDHPVNLMIMSSGVEFVEFMETAHESTIPDAVFLDLNMPMMDGWEALERLGEIPMKKKVTIYICSSSINPTDINKAKSMNEVSDYIIKPVDKTKIEDILKNVA